MPHNAVGSPCPDCSCATCACRLCFTAQGCGAAVEFDWGVYSAAGCTGGALFTGHAARGAAPCVCLGEPGTYWIQITPTGDDSALWRPRCYQVVMTAEDCAGGKEITIPLSPYTHSVEIDVTGCCGCALPGMSVSYDDGTGTGSGTTGLDGKLTLTGLNAPEDPDGHTATITVTGRCGYETKTVYVDVNVCSMTVAIALVPDADHVCIGGVWPMKRTLYYVGSRIGTVTLSVRDTGGDCSAKTWVGCTTYSCGDAAVPVVCTDDLYEAGDQYRYQSGSDTIPIVVTMTLLGTCCEAYTVDGVVHHRQRLLWDVTKSAPIASQACECGGPPNSTTWRMVGRGWCYVPGGFGVSATAHRITTDASCEFVCCGYDPGQAFPASWGFDEGCGRCVWGPGIDKLEYRRSCEFWHYSVGGYATVDYEGMYLDRDCDACWDGVVLASNALVNFITPICSEIGSPYVTQPPTVPEFSESYSITL